MWFLFHYSYFLNISIIISVLYSKSVLVPPALLCVCFLDLHAPVPLSEAKSAVSFLQAAPVLCCNQAVSSRAV